MSTTTPQQERDLFMLRPAGYWDDPREIAPSHLDPSRYHDAAREVMPLTGRSMAYAMPPGVWGATGTIIRKSDENGAPIGHNPNMVATRVNVDPDIPGQGFVIDPTRIGKSVMEKAAEHFQLGTASSVEDRRWKAANAFHACRVADRPDPIPFSTGREPPRESPLPMPGLYVVPQADPQGGQLPMSQPPPAQAYDPLGMAMPAEPVKPQQAPTQRFQQPQSVPGVPSGQPAPPPGQPANFAAPAPAPQAPPAAGFVDQTAPMQPHFPAQPAAPQAPPAQPQMQPQMQPPAQPAQGGGSLFARAAGQPVQAPHQPANGTPAAAPTVQIEFELQGAAASQTGWFHQVIRSGANLVLAFDNNAVGYPTAFPQTTQQDMAVHIVGQDVIYIVATTGIRFTFKEHDLCILLIKQEVPYGSA